MYSDTADSAAHPREFLDQPAFKEAAALLAADTVPLKTVLQYALGTNWELACAALSRLARVPTAPRPAAACWQPSTG